MCLSKSWILLIKKPVRFTQTGLKYIFELFNTFSARLNANMKMVMM